LKSFGPTALAKPGSVVVLATLEGLSKTGDSAVLLIDATGVVPIAREGEASPAGGTYQSFSDPVANADGSVAFAAELSTGPALFLRNAQGQLSVVAQSGQPAPEASGATWKKFVSFALPDGSESGVIVLAEVTGAGVSKKNKLGLWAQDETGNLVFIARAGSAIPGGDASKIVSKLAVLNALPPAQGSSRSYNDERSIAFLATFTDRSQAIQLVRLP
jgi:hypothetical protein